jgi:hypothetical protein
LASWSKTEIAGRVGCGTWQAFDVSHCSFNTSTRHLFLSLFSSLDLCTPYRSRRALPITFDQAT